MNLTTVGDLLMVAGWTLPAIAAPIEYAFVRDADGRRFGFRRSSMGRHLMSYMGAVAFLAVLGVVRLIFGEGPVWSVLRVVGFAALIAVTWWRWSVVHRARLDSIEDRHDSPLSP